MKNKKILGIILIVVLGVFAVSIFVVPRTLAIFRSSTTGTGTIQLASWNVSLNQTNINNSLNLVSGVTNQTYTLRVNSTSEVDVEYKVILSNVPDGVEVALVVPNQEKTFVAPDENHKITFNNVGTILYSDATKQKEHILEFKSNKSI